MAPRQNWFSGWSPGHQSFSPASFLKPSREYSMKLKMKLNVSYGFICFKICYSWCSHFFVSKVIVWWIQTTVSEFDSLKIEMLMWMHFFIVRRFLHVLLKSLLWLYFLEYCNQIYRRHVAMDEYESLKKSDRCGQWFWFYSKNIGFRSFLTGLYYTCSLSLLTFLEFEMPHSFLCQLCVYVTGTDS